MDVFLSFLPSSFPPLVVAISNSLCLWVEDLVTLHLMLFIWLRTYFPGGWDGKSVCLQCGRPGFDPWVRKIPWRRKSQPTPVFLPGKSHGRRSLVGYSPWGCKELDTTERLHFHMVKLKVFHITLFYQFVSSLPSLTARSSFMLIKLLKINCHWAF